MILVFYEVASTRCIYIANAAKLRKSSGITLKNRRDEAKQLCINAITASDEAKPKNTEKAKKSRIRRRTVYKELPDEK